MMGHWQFLWATCASASQKLRDVQFVLVLDNKIQGCKAGCYKMILIEDQIGFLKKVNSYLHGQCM